MGDLMLLSVIVPVYNAQAYLDRLFNSIKDQLNKEVELIFVDDGSLDNGYSILDCLCHINEGSILLCNKNNT